VKSRSPAILLLIVVLLVCLSSACRSKRTSETSDEASAGNSIETFMPTHVRNIFRRSCETCHGPDGRGITGVAPDIQRAQARSFEAWAQYLRDPHRAHPGATTPPVWLSEEETKAIAEFLARSNSNDAAPVATPTAR
jgi:mono/diheme cytochrome c family protein